MEKDAYKNLLLDGKDLQGMQVRPHLTHLMITLIDWEEGCKRGNFRIPKDCDNLEK